jgi:hypothetical protein
VSRRDRQSCGVCLEMVRTLANDVGAFFACPLLDQLQSL